MNTMRFRPKDIIKCNYTDSEHFAERVILKDPTNSLDTYITKFLEDDSVVESSAKVIDNLYVLK